MSLQRGRCAGDANNNAPPIVITQCDATPATVESDDSVVELTLTRMETRQAPEYSVELTADRATAKDVITAVLHTIFFHRIFTSLYPATHEVLDLTLPYVSEDDVESMIDQRTSLFLRQLETGNAQSKKGRGSLTVQFLEKKRKKSSWFVTKADEETIWETWNIEVNITGARSEPEAARNRQLMEKSLGDAALNILAIVNEERNHIPPITTNESNPFPYQILVNARG